MTGRSNKPLAVVYVVYWGLDEPLGRALVVPTVNRLARAGVRVTLVSFEKGSGPYNCALLAETGVEWLPLRYHKRPPVISSMFDIGRGTVQAIRAARRNQACLVHGRTFVGGLIAFVVALASRCRWIYHNEGFWPRERVAGGHWTATSLSFRVAQTLENYMHRSADAVVTLSSSAADAVRKLRGDDSVAVVPSAVDLDHFRPSEQRSSRRIEGTGLRLVYVGSLGGRYRLADMCAFAARVRRLRPDTTLTIYSHTGSEEIQQIAERAGVTGSFTLGRASYDSLPGILTGFDAGLHFIAPSSSSKGGSPTKIGEYWACGIPVVTTSCGDIDEAIRRHRVGVTVPNSDRATLDRAALELNDLLRDPDLGARCRSAAIERYSLDDAIETQLDLYRALCPSTALSTSTNP